jgi:hypothetical protein
MTGQPARPRLACCRVEHFADEFRFDQVQAGLLGAGVAVGADLGGA